MNKMFNRRTVLLIIAIFLIGSIVMIGCNKKKVESTGNSAAQNQVSEKKDSKEDKSSDDASVLDEKGSETFEDTTVSNKATKKKNATNKGKTWVPPVYSTVYHEEVGHYESQTYFRCICGQRFEKEDAWYKHWKDYMASNGGVCDRTHDRCKPVSEEVYVVDRAAYTEKVLVKKGYWK